MMTQHPQAHPTGIGAPGTEFGPCVGRCDHISCEAMKDRAKTRCSDCLNIIGYGRPFVDNGPAGGCTCGPCLDRRADQMHQRDEFDGVRAT